MEGTAGGLGALFVLVVLFWLYIWLPASMAAARGRSSAGWVVLTIFFSPIVTIIALVILGPTVEQAVEQALARARK